MIKIGILGASGYGGGELLRLLSQHPKAHLHLAISDTYADKPLGAAFPGLTRVSDLRFSPHDRAGDARQCDVVFLAQENGKAMKAVPALIEAGCKVIDLSADFRFQNLATYRQWYGMDHAAPGLCQEAAYGLPELFREKIRAARLVGNPGCYVTATTLALAPLLKLDLCDPYSLLVDAKSGVSGAGRSKFAQDYHFPEANESLSAYKISGTHRHTPEIEQNLRSCGAPEDLALTFTPHLVPMTRGILAACYATLKPGRGDKAGIDTQQLLEQYENFYRSEPFVVVRTEDLPSTKQVMGSNFCHIGLSVDPRNRRVTVISVIDNLVKGMAGQAIQNMNLMCGFEETLGIHQPGLWP